MSSHGSKKRASGNSQVKRKVLLARAPRGLTVEPIVAQIDPAIKFPDEIPIAVRPAIFLEICRAKIGEVVLPKKQREAFEKVRKATNVLLGFCNGVEYVEKTKSVRYSGAVTRLLDYALCQGDDEKLMALVKDDQSPAGEMAKLIEPILIEFGLACDQMKESLSNLKTIASELERMREMTVSTRRAGQAVKDKGGHPTNDVKRNLSRKIIRLFEMHQLPVSSEQDGPLCKMLIEAFKYLDDGIEPSAENVQRMIRFITKEDIELIQSRLNLPSPEDEIKLIEKSIKQQKERLAILQPGYDTANS
jgi:hypothetical protein